MKRKGCPLLIQSDTNPSMTISGQSWTRTYMLEWLGEKCAAYHCQDGFCEKFQTLVIMPERREENASDRC